MSVNISTFIYRLSDSEMNIIGFYTDENLAIKTAKDFSEGKINPPYELDEEDEKTVLIDVLRANTIGGIENLLVRNFVVGYP